jgi:eukaryotic-like serine/threonine-protein kinase
MKEPPQSHSVPPSTGVGAPSVRPPSFGPPAPSVPPPSEALRGEAWQLGLRALDAPRPAHEILRTQEVARTRVFFLLAAVLAVLVLLLAPVLGGDPVARRVLWASVIPAGLSSAWFARAIGDESRYSTDRVIFVGLLCLLGSLGSIHYFGVFSLAVAVLPVGLYFFGTIGDGRAGSLAYVSTAGAYFVLVAAILRGAVADRGLIATSASPPEKLVLAALVETVLLLTYLNARTARATALVTLARQDRLVRGLTQRDALLQEAKQDLARALDVAGVGRFSDTTVGSYQLGNVIGRGAMGEVYEAFHSQTRKRSGREAPPRAHPPGPRRREALRA